MQTLIIIPTYNEIDNLEKLSREIFLVLPQTDILIVDDNSPDGTGKLAERLAQKDQRIKVIHRMRKLGLGSGYTTVPTGQEEQRKDMWPADLYYRILGHKAKPGLEMFIEGKRVDTLFTDAHKQALADYNSNRCQMGRRYLQEDDLAVLWHNDDGTRATLWNFAARDVSLPGTVRDLTADKELPAADTYRLEACHTYAITGCELPTATGRADIRRG